MSTAPLQLNDRIRAAVRVGVPILILRTADPAQAITNLTGVLAGKVLIQWDVVRGAVAVNEASADKLTQSLKDAGIEQKATTNAKPFLLFIRSLPVDSIVFMMNLHRFASDDINVIQALWNLRDDFKSNKKAVIGLCPHMTLPAELSQDVLVMDEPLPTDTDLKAIAEGIYDSAQLPKPTPAEMEKIVDASLGLAAFPAEQAMAMSITRKGMNIDELWERKRKLIAQTEGLSVVKPTVTLDDVGGVSNAKKFMRQVMNGAEPPRCFCFVDEGEKSFAGSSVGSGDTSGVSQNYLGNFLTEMQEQNYSGVIFVGFPGSAKSMVAKAAGATAGVPTIQFDLAGMKNSLVGASEANLRKAFATIKAVSQGRCYFIMTANGIATLPPELKRRFRDGVFFFDLPVREEKDVIWQLYLKQYADRLKGIDLTLPNDEHWTGSEISTCVNNAYRFQISLTDASAYIVPSYLSMGSDRADALRKEASGRFVSASYPGPYNHDRQVVATAAATNRTIVFDEN